MSKNKFLSVNIGGISVNFTSLCCSKLNVITSYGKEHIAYKVLTCTVSFRTIQQYETTLSNIQKGLTFNIASKGGVKEEVTFVTSSYVGLLAKCKDDNTGDGYHAFIYMDKPNIVVVNKGEDAASKVFDKLRTFRVGLLPEWKNYILSDLISNGFIENGHKISTIDNAPTVYNLIDLSSEYKKEDASTLPPEERGAREWVKVLIDCRKRLMDKGLIKINVAEVEKLDKDMSFVQAIEKHIIPNIQNEECHFNVGKDEICHALKSKIKKGKNIIRLYLKQQIIAQGIINYLESPPEHPDGISSKQKRRRNKRLFKRNVILNGGVGIGKTYISLKIALGVEQILVGKIKSYNIAILCPSHLTTNWLESVIESISALGIKVSKQSVKTFEDVRAISKDKIGINFYIFGKDTVKSSHTHNYRGVFDKKFVYTDTVEKAIKTVLTKEKIETIKKSNQVIIFEKLPDIKDNLINLTLNITSSKIMRKVIMYREQENGIQFFTNSDEIKENFNLNEYKTVEEVKNIIINLSDSLKAGIRFENNKIDKWREERKNSIKCTKCGCEMLTGKPKEYFERDKKSILEDPKLNYTKKNGVLNSCKGFVRADGSSLTSSELMYLRKNPKRIIFSEEKSKEVYYTLKDELITDADTIRLIQNNRCNIHSVKQKIKEIPEFKIKVKRCCEAMYGCKLNEDKCGSITKKTIVNKKNEIKDGRKHRKTLYLLKMLGKNFFDMLIVDEFHKFRNVNVQYMAFTELVKASKVRILLSGTITTGFASNLYYIFWSIMPNKMVKMGYKFSDESLFVTHYGKKRKTMTLEKSYTSNKSGLARFKESAWEEIAGISPLIYNNFLLEIMVSRSIDDMGIPMPKIKYIEHKSEMTKEQAEGYKHLEQSIKEFFQGDQNAGKGIAALYTHKLKVYADYPQLGTITLSNPDGSLSKVCDSKDIDIKEILLPKEEKLIDTLKLEIQQDRNVIVYTEYVNSGLMDRLLHIINDAGIYAKKFLSSDGEIHEREQKVREMAKQGVRVLIVNPALVETGLNLLDFQTMYFYDQTYKADTLVQAEKRAYRPGQTRECRVYYSYYAKTIQEVAMYAIGKKKKALLAAQGVFDDDFLSNLAETSESVESMINKVLKGKMKLNEDDLKSFNFEEVDYSKEEKLSNLGNEMTDDVFIKDIDFVETDYEETKEEVKEGFKETAKVINLEGTIKEKIEETKVEEISFFPTIDKDIKVVEKTEKPKKNKAKPKKEKSNDVSELFDNLGFSFDDFFDSNNSIDVDFEESACISTKEEKENEKSNLDNLFKKLGF